MYEYMYSYIITDIKACHTRNQVDKYNSFYIKLKYLNVLTLLIFSLHNISNILVPYVSMYKRMRFIMFYIYMSVVDNPWDTEQTWDTDNIVSVHRKQLSYYDHW